MHKVFISYHHANDQWAKEQLSVWGIQGAIFEDMSVGTLDIDDTLPAETIRCKIRDEYLRDSSVTILLVGTETKNRKHVDWEIYSSMRDGPINKKSGILIIQLPSTNPKFFTAPSKFEKEYIYSDVSGWISISDRAEYERRYPYLPSRIIDNLLEPKAVISVTGWDRISKNPNVLHGLIDNAHHARVSNEYDLSRPMRSANS